jgi:phospholipid-binding lipoprotein MlaA
MNKLLSLLAICLLAGCATVHKQEAAAPGSAAVGADKAPVTAPDAAPVATELKSGDTPGSDDKLLNGLEKDYGASETSIEEMKKGDPLKPWNVVWYHFNDKFYLWVLYPVANGYGKVMPLPARRGVNNFFENLKSASKFVSCLLQGRWEDMGCVVERFCVNTTAGGFGFYDFADKVLHVADRNEDTDQAFGRWGIKPGWYIVWPFLGPSSVRGSVGLLGDSALSPTTWVPYSEYISPGTSAINSVNGASLDPDFYKDMKKGMADPYAAIRHAYTEYRKKLVAE